MLVIGFFSHSGLSDMTIWHFATVPPLMSIFNCDIISSLKHKNGTRNSYIPFNQTYLLSPTDSNTIQRVNDINTKVEMYTVQIFSIF